MNNFRFITYLTSNIGTDQAAIEQLLSHCSIREFKKGEFLLRQGEKCRYSFFVERGLLRQFSIDEKGKEHIIQFAPENWFMSDRESVYFDRPSSYFMQALEDTVTFLLDENLFLELSKSDTAFLEFNNRLLHNHIRHLQRRITQLQSATAEERYLDFIRMYPDLLLRVPQIFIASYLGITPESLSRVRKELAGKNHRM
ncbi:Crp/Fnr family transcriptional regulator [Leadbetterella sp. DM7]|uniref:Crp/Fnr family transcriptional regulator n=1 Tax=Leadbetterella sp. DM7 TaxID=3235085 RepID=UPI00349EB261